MAKSTSAVQKGKPQKPSKPYKDFPLFAHATGRWAKKIRGKLRYFGYWNKSLPDGDWRAALDRYQEERDDLQSGRTPRTKRDGLTVADLCNRFLTGKKQLLDTGELARRTFGDYHKTCKRVVKVFTGSRLVADLATDDFARLRAQIAATQGPVSLGVEISRVRMIFKYGYDAGLIENSVRYGPGFKKPSRKTLRKARQEKGKRMFEADELRTILDAASGPMRAMILLGINCGFGQTDIANLPQSFIDFDTGWIDYPRPKTGVDRRCLLWPETVSALKEAIAARPAPADKADADLCFLTAKGYRCVRMTEGGSGVDSIAPRFGKVRDAVGITGHRSFYALRHGFRTVADASKDQPAIDHIMGHVRDDMASLYREGISDERLQAVVDVVRSWLWPEG